MVDTKLIFFIPKNEKQNGRHGVWAYRMDRRLPHGHNQLPNEIITEIAQTEFLVFGIWIRIEKNSKFSHI